MDERMETTRGIVFDIQRSALNDGPGLRTTVFLKGCPLRCKWCHNPESWSREPQVNQSGKVFGTSMSVEQVMEVVRLDKAYYASSGGGITISGGEPLFQLEFTLALLKAARAEGIQTCLDTSGFAPRAALQQVLPWVDLFHFDYKATGDALHHELTGVPRNKIVDNLEFLIQQNARIILRCPMLPEINDSDEHLDTIRSWASPHPNQIQQIDLLPYHSTGFHKYHELGMEASAMPFQVPTEDQIARWQNRLPMAHIG